MKLLRRKNKRGGNEVPLWGLVVIIPLCALIIGVATILFYGAPYDVRNIENRVLMNQVADCVSYAGKINANIIPNGIVKQNSQDFLNSCHLIFSSSDWKEEQYYAEVNFYNPSDLELSKSLLTIKKGNSDWVSNCGLQKNQQYGKLAQCTEKVFYSLDDKNNQYIIKILSIVRKSEKNVKF
jgi:hypothetical protein